MICSLGDNTDLCYNELGAAPYANGIDANGFSVYDDEGPIHCHGFAWSADELEASSRFKANALFFVSMYDHMYQRGYVGNVPGSPMCGCVEDMPIVTRADCTQTNIDEDYLFLKDYSDPDAGVNGVIEKVSIQFKACQGANNKNNDLTAHVQQLVDDGKLSAEEQDLYASRVVGNGQCPTKRDELLSASDYTTGYYIDESRWTYVVGESFGERVPILNSRLFREMFEAQDVPIVRRVCPGCSPSHRDIYYRRLTPMPEDFDLLDTLMNNWFDTDNVLNTDFALYSTHLDAFYDTNRWLVCNYNDPGIGFPRDCGPTKLVGGNWNSYYRGGGHAHTHAFLLPADDTFTSQLSNIALGDSDRRSTVHQQGISNGGTPERALDGDTSGIYFMGGVTRTHEEEDPYWQVELQHNSTIRKVYMWRCIHGCRNNNQLTNINVEVYDHMYGDVVASRTFAGGDNTKKLYVVDFGTEGVEGQVVRITSETNPGQRVTLSLAEVEIDGDLGPAIDHETFAEVDADEYADQSGIGMHEGNVLAYFDTDDYVTYASLNFGSLGSTKSLLVEYAKGNGPGASMEIRLGGKDGLLIGELFPTYSGGWLTWKEEYVPIAEVEGIHDLTFVGKGGSGVLNLLSFDLSSNLPLQLSAAYKVDDDKNQAIDIQCGYETLLSAYTEQIYDKVSSRVVSAEAEFLEYLGVDSISQASDAADALCVSAQATVIDAE